MAKFRLHNMAELARQMSFAPRQTLAAELTAAEHLLHDIDPAKAYPWELVVFRITGYRPRQNGTSELLTGLALQHDLGLLIERLSDRLELDTRQVTEPVLSIEDVAERFNVTSKTIQRWRRRGLAARRFTFPDGKRRVGFLLSSVERFFTVRREQVVRGMNFSQVDQLERQRILRQARRLAGQCGCCPAEIARRIARKLNRSPLTILHTIRKHDQENPQAAIFPSAQTPLSQEDCARILRAYRRGVSLKQLARKYHRNRAAIYRVIIDERIARLNRRKVNFIDDPLYHQPDAAATIQRIVEAAQQQIPAQSPAGEELRIPKDLPPYLQELYRTPLLTVEQERALFLKFNFHKWQFVQARRRLEPQFARARELDVLEGYLRQAIETKNAIVRANLRLVVSVARKHLRPGLNLMELISEGNLTLMRAVESFDIHRGNRFSTYATLALMKGFARSVPLMQAAASHVRGQPLVGDLPDTRQQPAIERLAHRDQVQALLARLDERERIILRAHYGLNDSTAAASYEELGVRLGISKQRVRQIEQAALAKLRGSIPIT
ncbi:sigma-70 family RNA polymerase sigma factor [Fontivita pretiosa]|uniref:sigma-70 family RNA polymerase sigma factor n=1 Tax=Fontivita pretiosa TaxID=2989684 RepID=UPI003D173067